MTAAAETRALAAWVRDTLQERNRRHRPINGREDVVRLTLRDGTYRQIIYALETIEQTADLAGE